MSRILALKNYILLYIYFLVQFSLSSCNTQSPNDKLPAEQPNVATPMCDYPQNPVMVIIGEDLSGSFSQELSLTTADVQAICDVISSSGRGGQVVVGAIGDQNPKGYVNCDIKPLPIAPKTL
ncbi:MAG: hypothetical protein IPK76_12985 [Lewinellaceae bacterium]|nr:hypothetical protein [Lewinellaceae bacterium]